MYRAVYEFKATNDNALDFSENDLFTVLDNTRDQYWWLVQNGKGQIGFVPANYLKKNEASFSDVIESIDRAIEAIHNTAPNGDVDSLPQLKKANLQKLIQHKENVLKEHEQPVAASSPPPQATASSPPATHGGARPRVVSSDASATSPAQGGAGSRDASPSEAVAHHVKRPAPQVPSTGRRGSSKRVSAPPPPPVRNSVLSSPSPTTTQQVEALSPEPCQSEPHEVEPYHTEPAAAQSTQPKPADAEFELITSDEPQSTLLTVTSPNNIPRANSPAANAVTFSPVLVQTMPVQAESAKAVHFQPQAAAAPVVETSPSNEKKETSKRSILSLVSNTSSSQAKKASAILRRKEKPDSTNFSSDSQQLTVNYTAAKCDASVKTGDGESSKMNGQPDHAQAAASVNTKSTMATDTSPPSVGGQKAVVSATEEVDDEIARRLVEKIRSVTQMNYGKCQHAVELVLHCLRHDKPSIAPVMDSLIKSLHKQEVDTSSKVDLTTDDAVRLQRIFTELAKCKDDAQQRSWFLHEDEHFITDYIKDLLSVLEGANADVSKSIIKQNDFMAINNLVLYYQMETRATLRLLLLQVFGSLCGLDAMFISELLNSVLPLELARDIQTDTADVQKLNYSCLVLTMIFSMAESVPLQYYALLNHNFVNYLFNMVEERPESDASHQIPELVTNLILAYNLHFELPAENIIMKVLAKRHTSKLFTERIMYLLNRGDDPVRMFDHAHKPPSSILKFLSDLYSSRATSGVLYTNDARVLIDIITGQITDLSPSDHLRTDYLSLVELVLKNTDYSDHKHRRADLQLCFRRIYNEEQDSTNDMDKNIVKQIWAEFPDIFSAD